MFVLLGIFSCKKTNNATTNTSVKASEFDENTQQYVPNVKLLLWEVQKVGGQPQINGQVLKTVNTDANGQGDFGAFEARESSDYYYVVTEDHGINYTVQANVIKGQNNTIAFTVHASANIAIKFIPPPPYITGDSLSVTFTNKNYPLNPFTITNSNYSHYSQFPSLSLDAGYQYINIDKYKSGIYTNTKDTVFYSANSTHEYDVYW